MQENLNNSNDGNSRRNFIKNLSILGGMAVTKPIEIFSHFNTEINEQVPRTNLKPTSEKFQNGECVWKLENEKGEQIGEFWPIHGLNLITKQTDPKAFKGNIDEIQKNLGDKEIVATVPDGMTGGSFGSYVMEGKALSNGRECGDGQVKDYGIILVKNGFNITFTHKREHENDFDKFYDNAKKDNDTLFYLPSIYRNGKFLPSSNKVDKVLIRRDVPKNPTDPKSSRISQIGVILFNSLITYNQARENVLGLDRNDKGKTSTTTHIYVLDGGASWGQSTKIINGKPVIKGTRDPDAITNYLVFY